MTLYRELLRSFGLAPDGPRPRRGRPRRSPLQTLRARTWYWHVKILSGLSDYELNNRFLYADQPRAPGEPQTKGFERIRARGVVPSDARHGNLIDRVDAVELYRGTAGVFRSRFWDLLQEPDMSLGDLKVLIGELSLIVGLARPRHVDIWGAGPGRPRIGLNANYRCGLELLSRVGTLDSAALMGALYKEALCFGETEVGTVLKTAFISAMVAYSDKMQAHIEDRHITRVAQDLSRHAPDLCETAIERVLHTAKGAVAAGDHAEIYYAFEPVSRL